jgi:hypothetical protein
MTNPTKFKRLMIGYLDSNSENESVTTIYSHEKLQAISKSNKKIFLHPNNIAQMTIYPNQMSFDIKNYNFIDPNSRELMEMLEVTPKLTNPNFPNHKRHTSLAIPPMSSLQSPNDYGFIDQKSSQLLPEEFYLSEFASKMPQGLISFADAKIEQSSAKKIEKVEKNE